MEGKLIKSLDFLYVLASITKFSTQLLLPQISLTQRDVESRNTQENQIYHRTRTIQSSNLPVHSGTWHHLWHPVVDPHV